jgi:ABC-type antimicrobial peptide transport system permease subunit
MAFVLRSSVPPAELASVARDRVWQVDPVQPVDDVRTMKQIHRDDFSGDLAMISLIVFFGAVAFGLAVAGVYGVVSYSVSQRRREIGVRMAVGARSEDVLRMVTRQGVTQVLVGVVVGIFLGLLLSHSLTGMLYGVSPTDPVTFLGVPILLLVVGVVASLIPARRAARLDPIDTLRTD